MGQRCEFKDLDGTYLRKSLSLSLSLSLIHTDRQTDKQTNRQTDKQTNRQTDKQTMLISNSIFPIFSLQRALDRFRFPQQQQ